MTTKTQTHTCSVSGCTEPTHTIGGSCEKHNAGFRAKWREEHTRKPGDTRKGWLIGDRCQVKLGKITYDAEIIDMSNVIRSESNYHLEVHLRLTKTVKGLDGKPYASTWVHPEPVQSYKLKKALLK